MRVLTARLGVCLALIVMAAAPTTAGNLVANGDFDTDTAGWTPFADVTLEWDATSDATNQPDSGSAVIIADLPDYTNSGAIQCINGISGGALYDLSAWLRVPTGQSASGAARVFVWWYPQPGCVGPPSAGPTTGDVFPSDQWVERTAPSAIAPSDATSAVVYLNAAKQTAAGTFQASYDHVVLTSDTIFVDGFESGGTGAWSGQVGG